MSRLTELVLVGFGGAFGSAVRYAVTLGLGAWSGFPYATLAVNLTGSFVAGMLVGLGDARGLATPARLLLVTGFLGGYTTFSAFSVETMRLAETQGVLLAGMNVVASVGIGLALAAAGLVVGRGL